MSLTCAVGKTNERLTTVFAKTAVDRVSILRANRFSDGKGGTIKEEDSEITNPVPCTVQSKQRYGGKDEATGVWISKSSYVITFPVMFENEVLQLLPSDRLRIEERETFPAKTYKIVTVKNILGVYFEVDCNLEE
jgi:hypothetical protein